jgi:putative membrane protein
MQDSRRQWTPRPPRPGPSSAKIVLVVGLSGFHGYLMGLGPKIAVGQRPVEPRRLRMLNEIPMIIAIFAVIAVVVQPFAS